MEYTVSAVKLTGRNCGWKSEESKYGHTAGTWEFNDWG